MESVDCIVVGGGVVGLAAARELALRGREVLVLEAETAIGQHASARNTGVIHAGLNYRPGSLKARLCREGRDLLYAYCAERGVAHRRLGKLIPARPDAEEVEIAALRRFMDTAIAGGCADLVWLGSAETRALEPALRAPAAVLSPSSGIVDQHELMMALWGDLSNRGGQVLVDARAVGGAVGPEGIEIEIGGAHASRVRCALCVNAAGFDAPLVARSLAGLDHGAVPARLLQKGSYFVHTGRSPFSRLVYPFRHGLHASLDVSGRLRLGPDSEWVDAVDYAVDPARAAGFYEKARQFWPDLADGALAPG